MATKTQPIMTLRIGGAYKPTITFRGYDKPVTGRKVVQVWAAYRAGLPKGKWGKITPRMADATQEQVDLMSRVLSSAIHLVLVLHLREFGPDDVSEGSRKLLRVLSYLGDQPNSR